MRRGQRQIGTALMGKGERMSEFLLGVIVGAFMYGLYDLISWWRKGKR